MRYVLELCPTPSYVNITLLKELISTYMAPRIGFYNVTNKNLYVEDEFSEYFLAKATNGIQIGNGHCPMDVKVPNGDGIDAMCVCLNGNQTNEKSIIQNFSESGKQLDGLFADKKDTEAIQLYMKDLKKKWANVKTDKGLNDLYYMCLTSTKTKVYFSTFKINPDLIDSVTTGGFRSSEKNILVNNFIDPIAGTVTLYKSKKRVELRLKAEVISHANTIELFSQVTAPSDLQ